MEPTRDLVIKVKYGDSLKRLTASVTGSNLDLDIAKLRGKIILAFNLSPSSDFIMTYGDVDGDTIMLDDDEDLCDAAVNQKLNPLRINVELRSQPNVAPAAEPKPNATNPFRHTPFDDMILIGPSHEKVLRSPSRDIRKTLSTVTENVGNNKPPIVKELVTTLSKLDLSHATYPASQPVNFSSGSSGSPACATIGTSTDSANTTAAASKKCKEPKVVHVSHKGAPSGLQISDSCGKKASDNTDADIKAAPEMQRKGKAVMQNSSQKCPFRAPPYRPPMPHTPHTMPRGPFFGPQPGLPPSMNGPLYHTMQFPPLNVALPPPPPPLPPAFDCPPDHAFLSHVKGDVDAAWSYIPPYPSRFSPAGHSYKKADIWERMRPVCPRAITCDGCNASPIVGTRYKSIVKDDYDLCVNCFERFGKPEEYTKISYPTPRMPWALKSLPKYQPVSPPFVTVRGSKMRSKLESRFIQDVTIPDGTIISPSTPFTKIWRMRNNGSSLWPFGTQLVWVGGDQLTSRTFFQLEIPVDGLPFDEEVDIAVDFCAPARAGRYLSYWRLATPSGQKFGQRVWVLVQVEEHVRSKQDIESTIDLNVPPVLSPNPDTIDDAESTNVQSTSEPSVNNTTSNVGATIDETKVSIIEGEANTIDYTSVPPPVSYPLIDISPAPEAVADPSPSVPVEEATDKNEDVLLKELEDMGFKQVDLNKEVLRLNKYDLEQCVEELCGFAEWDPLLEELKEMGFDDQEKNKKLLVKNSGSIKRVVMDLIAGEKAE